MQEWVGSLLELQALDVKAAKIEELLATIPRQMEEVKNLYQAENDAAEAAKKNVQAVTARIHDIENEIASVRTQKGSFQSKSALIKNNDEYRAAMLQIELCDKRISELEDSQILAMDELEQAQALLRERTLSLNEAKHRADGVVADLEVRRKNATASLQELTAQRPSLASAVEPRLLAKYDRLRNSRQNVKTRECVVPIVDRVCDRCHMKVTDQAYISATKGEHVICGSCGAMLYAQE